MVERHLSILADLDEVAVGIAQIAAPFPTVIVQWLGKEERSLVAPLFVASPDVGDAQVKEAIRSTVTNSGPRSCAVSEDGRQDSLRGLSYRGEFRQKVHLQLTLISFGAEFQ